MSSQHVLEKREKRRVKSGDPRTPLPPRGPREFIRDLCIRLRLYPHISLQRMPFKTYEFQELLREADLRDTDRVLDLGCGIGTQTLILGRRCETVVGVDICEDSIEKARSHAKHFKRYIRSLFLCGKVEELHLDEHSFDKICSFCVIEHIPNHMDVLRELHRLLVPGGELILSADSLETIDDPGLLAKHREENKVVTYFREDTLRQALEESGFRDTKIRPIFRSKFAHRKFCSMIRNMGRRRSYVGSQLEYLWLRFQERWTRNKKRGIFLVARCRK